MRKGRGWLRSYAWSAPSLTLIALMVVFPILYTLYISLTNMSVYHWFDFSFIGWKTTGGRCWCSIRAFCPPCCGRSVDDRQHGRATRARLRAGKPSERKKTAPAQAVQDHPHVSLGDAGGTYPSSCGRRASSTRSSACSTSGRRRWGWRRGAGWPRMYRRLCFARWSTSGWALPFMIMIMDGAMQSIDESYYESARLDGATRLQRAVYITIPTIRPMIAPAVIITVFTTFKQFDVVYLLTQQMGAQTGSNFHTVLTYAYENAFITNNYGYSSAISMLIFALLLLFSPPAAKGGDQVKRGKLRSIASMGALNLFFHRPLLCDADSHPLPRCPWRSAPRTRCSVRIFPLSPRALTAGTTSAPCSRARTCCSGLKTAWYWPRPPWPCRSRRRSRRPTPFRAAAFPAGR